MIAASEHSPDHSRPSLAGDHDVVLCKVVGYENLVDDPAAVLYTDTLRKAGLM
mgnify:CR=1 FL=1